MTLVRNALRSVFPNRLPSPISYGSYGTSGGIASNPQAAYLQYARQGYGGNEIVYSAIELRATSAAEPHIIGRRFRRNRAQIRTQARGLKAVGLSNRAGAMVVDALMVRNGFFEELEDHPLVKILNNPNPYMSRGQLWSTTIVDRDIAGNAYLLKARYTDGLLKGAMGELWRLRPDRVRIIPGENGDRTYRYTVGREFVDFPSSDICHFKTRNPFDDYYGMPPMMPVMGRIAIDSYMTRMVRAFYERGGGPGAILSTKNKMDQKDKDDARDRLRRLTGHPEGIAETLILDNADGTTYTQMGLNRGLRDAIPIEIDHMNEARIAMIYGIPGSILGLLIGYESSSYANKRQDWQVLWDVTMTPLLSDFNDVLNLSLVPEFAGIDEVLFDLSDIRALQEDYAAIQDQARKNVDAGLMTIEEGRPILGLTAVPNNGEHLLLPTRGTLVPTPIEDISPERPPPLALPGPAAPATPAALMMQALALMLPSPSDAPRLGRPRIEDDAGARAIWDQARELRETHPGLTLEVLAARVGVSERTLRRYRQTFEDED